MALFVFAQDVSAAEPTVRFEPVFEKIELDRPVFLTHPGDGTDRLFVVEQRGRVLWFDNDPEVAEANLAIDISKDVFSPANQGFNEEGLLGLAFHPQFKNNGYVYLHYSIRKPRGNVLSRFVMDTATGVIDVKSEQRLFHLRQPFPNHNGGMIAFGPDGYLYIALGDGGAANDPLAAGQRLNTWLGKILRIDVDHADRGENYAAPKDNPFIDQPGAKPEIWAFGLRNVWRFSFDRKTGVLYGGDVGQDLWEEIDVIVKGGNYGWNAYEGARRFAKAKSNQTPDDHIPPIAEYSHSQGQSVTGGYVYRGRRFPLLDGVYFYADYQSGLIWTLRHDPAKGETTAPKLVGRLAEISSFGEDRDGELYIISLQGRIDQVRAR